MQNAQLLNITSKTTTADVAAHYESLGLTTHVLLLEQDKYELNEDKYFKVNIPDSKEGYNSGNGEGMWCQPLTEEDEKIYESGSGSFDVVLLNDSVYIPPLFYGTVIRAEARGNKRPVLDIEWLRTTKVDMPYFIKGA